MKRRYPFTPSDPAAVASNEAKGRRWVTGWRLRALGLAGLAIGATLLGQLGRFGHYFDLFAHFTPYYFAAALFTAAALGLGRSRKPAVVAACCAVPAGMLIAPLYWPARSPTFDTATEWRVLFANVQYNNAEYGPMLKLIHDEQPDLLGVVEFTGAWEHALSAIEADFPYRELKAHGGAFGIGLYSKWPLSDARIEMIGPVRPGLNESVACIVATVEKDGAALTVVVVHVYPPFNPWTAKLRDEQLDDLAALLATLEGPVVLMGDLNLTPWSPHYRKRLAQWNLLDGRAGRGIRPTWPSPSPIMIPIDHILHNASAHVSGLTTGPAIGSDHRPLSAVVHVPVP